MGVLRALAQRVIREGPHLTARRRDTRQFAAGRVGVIRRVAIVLHHNIYTHSE